MVILMKIILKANNILFLFFQNIYPSSIISHSAGDQAAAFIAGRLSLEEAVRMLAVSMSEEEVENKLLKVIEHLACITIVNSPRLVTISGDEIQQILPIAYPNVFEACVYQKQIFNSICAKPKLYSSIIGDKMNDNIPVDSQILLQLTTSSQVWQQYFHTRQILPMKNHEEYFDDFPLYKFHLSSCWYESKDPSIQRLANRIPTHPLLGIRQLNDRTKDDQQQKQPTIIFEDVKFVKVLILNEHELVEVFTQISMPLREWYIIFCNQDNLNKYSLNEFILHAQGKIEIDSIQQKSLTIPNTWTTEDITSAYRYGSSFQKIKTIRGTSTTVICQLSNDDNNCSSYYLLHPYLVLLPGVEITFLPLRI
ncbi:unnamed protein product [Adineta steineri]|uniref:Malonyl-CoA:ACP transacylase (MAT) domain-containing protein n=1 Tax=Adineta steineri TaxID=433720 RepID=A0A814N9T9_9BILA|nr:unnamed protein product [Adineta steineri]CAF1285014.1 unnamed protein product [Adineta steineri]